MLFASGLVVGAAIFYLLAQFFPGIFGAGRKLKRDGIGKILLPIGDFVLSEETVRAACSLAQANGALLYGLSIVEIPMALTEGAMLEEEMHAALKVLDSVSRMASRMGCQLIPLQEQSHSAAKTVMEVAADQGFDVILWEGRFEPGISPFFGKGSDYVFEKAPTFVLLSAKPSS